jgi:phosphate starvation-inducible protein PhoH
MSNTKPRRVVAQQTTFDMQNTPKTQGLFEKHMDLIKGVSDIFEVTIEKLKGSEVEIKPKPIIKAKHGRSAKQQRELLVNQAHNTLSRLIDLDVLLTKEVLSHIVLDVTKDKSNEEKTAERLKIFLGDSEFNRIAAPKNDTARSDLLKPTTNSLSFNLPHSSGDFGETISKNKHIIALFKNKLGITLSYYGKERRITLKNNPKSQHDLNAGVAIINYLYQESDEDAGALAVQNIERVIANAISGRDLGYVDKAEQKELQHAKARHVHRLPTYNPSGHDMAYVYPRENQSELSNAVFDIEQTGGLTKTSQGKKIVCAIGPAASGKTAWFTFLAVAAFKLGIVKKIVICRPNVSAGTSGKSAALPGGIKEKTAPMLMPIYENLLKVMPEAEVAKYLVEAAAPGTETNNNPNIRRATDGRSIEICDLEQMRGRTFENAIIIGDEMQNAKEEQLKMFLTRIGKGSRALFTLDPDQIDLPNIYDSCAIEAIIRLKDACDRGQAPDIKLVACNGNLRDPVVSQVLSAFGDNQDDMKRKPRTLDDHYQHATTLRQERTRHAYRDNMGLSKREQDIVRVVAEAVLVMNGNHANGHSNKEGSPVPTGQA